LSHTPMLTVHYSNYPEPVHPLFNPNCCRTYWMGNIFDDRNYIMVFGCSKKGNI
jgi:hypothetical protein